MKTTYKNSTYIKMMLLLCFLLFTSGCAATIPGKLSTPSGRPEVTIPNTNIQTVMDGIATWLASQDLRIISTTAYTITAGLPRNADEWPFCVSCIWPCTYTVVTNNSDVKIYSAIYFFGNNETTTQSDYDGLQLQLTQIAAFLKTH